jgi:hypothetical protein
MQYAQMIRNSVYGSLLANPIAYTPSITDEGQARATTVEVVNAKTEAYSKIGAGAEDQNQSAPVRAENKVKKSEIDTFK